MPIYKPSELFRYLESLGISPKKSLSQNFLLDGNILRKIVSLAEITPGDVVLEIGPGPGALTEIMLDSGATVVAVEKDPVLAQGLERLQGRSGHLTVFCDDILAFPIEKTLQRFVGPDKKAKIVANLPYHLTSPIVTLLVPLRHLLSTVVVMLQEEVARRYTALPGTKDYGSITLFLRYHAETHYGFSVSRNCFYPKPNVDSAVVRFNLREPPPVSSEQRFFEMVHIAFGQRRKMLSSTLRAVYPANNVRDTLQKMGKSPKARPEELSLEEFLELFENLSNFASSGINHEDREEHED